MKDYQPLLIEKMHQSGNSPRVFDTSVDFDVWVQTLDYDTMGAVKELPKNDWLDEHGIEEFAPMQGLYLREAQMTIGFICIADREKSTLKVRRFLEYLIGLDGSGVFMKLFATNLGYGLKDVRYLSAKDFTIIPDDEKEILTFKVQFQVNDPITKIVKGQGLMNNRLVEG